MTTPRPGSRAEQRRRTEARILGAATEVFFSARYDRTTIRAVASAAGMAAGLVCGPCGEAAVLILAGLASRLASEPVRR
jgi:hypothetical protein